MAELNTEINVPTFEQISTRLSQLLTNYSNMASDFYDLFYNPEPKDITLQLYNVSGTLVEHTIPNRAKDFRYVRNGEGSPEGVETAPIGTIYMDTTNGELYIKQISSGNIGWAQINVDNGITRGFGSPEGVLVRERGTLYVDMTASSLYVKSTDLGSAGWVLISSDMSSVANNSLSNLSEVGEKHFANPSLSNLNNIGNGIINSKANDNEVVHLTKSETISGTKTFSSSNQGSNSLVMYQAGTDTPNIKFASSGGTHGYIGIDSNKKPVCWNGELTDTAYNMVRVTRNNAVGSSTKPVYVNENGFVTPITSYEGTSVRATADASGNNIINTYATKSELEEKIDGKQDIRYTTQNIAGTSTTIPAVYLKVCYVNGTSGYNIWSNGYCEQWGRVFGGTDTTVTLPKTYKDYNFSVAGSTNVDVGVSRWELQMYIVSNNQIQIRSYDPCNKDWRTCGYLAEGGY